MSVSRFSCIASNQSDAAFRLWGEALSLALTAVGITKVAGEPDINWGTVTVPGTNTYVYEIREFTDALAATAPCKLKVEYGTGGTAGYCTVRITAGKTSNGSGALGGGVSDTAILGASSASVPATAPCMVSSDGGRLSIGMWVGLGASYTWGMYIERTKDANGDPTTDGFNFGWLGSTGSTAYGWQYIAVTGTYTFNPATHMPGPMCAASAAIANYGLNVGLYPIYPNRGYPDNPDLGALVYIVSAFNATGALITASMYGADHTFLLLGATYGGTNGTYTVNGGSLGYSLALRCE